MSQIVNLSQDIQDHDEDIEVICYIFNTDDQGRLGMIDGPISKPYGYLIYSFKDLCKQYHGILTRAELDEVKTYLESKMGSMQQKIFNSKQGFVKDGATMSDGVYVSSNVLCSKRRKTYGTIHIEYTITKLIKLIIIKQGSGILDKHDVCNVCNKIPHNL